MLLLLPRIDDDLAAKAREVGCSFCGGRLDVADYPRKPRGADELGDEYSWRRSFCCAVDGCRRRRTPVSVRFLGRKVYLGAVVALATALQRGPSKTSVTKLSALLGISRRTLARWCRWWSMMFATSRFWTSLRGRFMGAEVQLIVGTISAKLPAENVYFAKGRAGFEGSLRWLEGNLADTLRLLPSPRDLSLFEVTLFCLVAHLSFCRTVSLQPFPSLVRFTDELATRPSAQHTQYRFDKQPTDT